MNKSARANFLIYVLLFLGYMLFYVYDIEYLIYPNYEQNAKPKTQFVYQQF
jgi:hypothetical protein